MSSEEILIRPMRATDAAVVLEMANRLKNTPHWPLSAYLSALDPHGTPRRVALVAVEAGNNSPIGFAIASLMSPQAELESIAVGEDRQGKGLGSALLDALIGELHSERVGEIWLEVRVSNEPALRLYRRTGFSESGRRKLYYADPNEDAIVMGLTIA